MSDPVRYSNGGGSSGEDDVLDFFNYYYEPARRHTEAMSDEWAVYESAFYGEPDQPKPEGEDAWRSYIFYKYAHQQIKTLQAELASDDDPTFMYEPRRPEQEQYADDIDNLISSQLMRDKYPDKRLRVIEYAAVYGGCPVKVHWNYKCVERTRLTPGGIEKVHLVLHDQPTISVLDPRDFMYDPRARSMEEARYAFHRMRLSLAELESRKKSDGTPLYKNLDELAENASTAFKDNRVYDHDYSGERDKASRQGIEVVEMWTAERVIVRANGHVIIRDEPNPYWHGRLPFEVINLIPSLNDVWGTSIMWLLRDPQENLWTLDNATNDSLKLSIDPPLAVDMEDPENAQRPIAPRERFPSRDPKSAVQPIQVTGMQPYLSAQAVDAQLQKVKSITGITDEIAGTSSADSATQAALNQRQSKGRIGIMLNVLDGAFARVAELFLALNQQYLDLSQPVKILGAEGMEWRHLSPQAIAGMWDVRAKSASEKAVVELRQQSLMEALSAVTPAVNATTATGKTIDITPIVKELVETFHLPAEQIIVDADLMRNQHAKDIVSEAQAQAQAMQITQPPPEPQQDPVSVAQAKLFESINYKDIPPAAKAAMLQGVNLPADGVGDPQHDPTAVQQPNPLTDALTGGAGAGGGNAVDSGGGSRAA